MIVPIAAMTLALILGGLVGRHCWRTADVRYRDISLVVLPLVGFACGGLVLGIVPPAIMGVNFTRIANAEPLRTAQLVTLRDGGSRVSGTFFLGSGTIKSEPAYFYFRQRRDGTYAAGEDPMFGRVVVLEEDRADAIREEFGCHFEHHWQDRIAFQPDDVCLVRFRVPRGTVLRGFSL